MTANNPTPPDGCKKAHQVEWAVDISPHLGADRPEWVSPYWLKDDEDEAREFAQDTGCSVVRREVWTLWTDWEVQP